MDAPLFVLAKAFKLIFSISWKELLTWLYLSISMGKRRRGRYALSWYFSSLF